MFDIELIVKKAGSDMFFSLIASIIVVVVPSLLLIIFKEAFDVGTAAT
jgi:hypothetical protein